jgi:hypothetical protein
VETTKRITLSEELFYFNTQHIDPFFFGEARETIIKFLEEVNSTTTKERKFLDGLDSRLQAYAMATFVTIVGPVIVCVYHQVKATKMRKSLLDKMNQACLKYNSALSKLGYYVIASSIPIKRNENEHPIYYFEFSKADKVVNTVVDEEPAIQNIKMIT